MAFIYKLYKFVLSLYSELTHHFFVNSLPSYEILLSHHLTCILNGATFLILLHYYPCLTKVTPMPVMSHSMTPYPDKSHYD